MKRINWIVAVLAVFLGLFISWGGGGGGSGAGGAAPPVVCNPASVAHGAVDPSTCAITCDTGYVLSLPGATCVSLSRIKREGFKAIPEAEYAEQIVFAMIESFAKTHSD